MATFEEISNIEFSSNAPKAVPDPKAKKAAPAPKEPIDTITISVEEEQPAVAPVKGKKPPPPKKAVEKKFVFTVSEPASKMQCVSLLHDLLVSQKLKQYVAAPKEQKPKFPYQPYNVLKYSKTRKVSIFFLFVF